MKTDEKWFYPIQENLLTKLRSDYNHIACLYQDVLFNRVYEAYECYDNIPDSLPVILLAVLHKTSGRFHLYKMIER
jgi:hypothetical protein